MHSSPLISVITVCYNSVEFIESCLKSVVNQDFNDYEYVVIDGGSEDGTVDVIKKYQNSINYWHSKKDQGLSDAFNIGIKHSKGDWVLYINADDYLLNQSVLSQMASYLNKWPNSDVVIGQIMLMNREHMPIIKSGPHGKPFSWRELRFKAIIPHQAAFTNRKYFRTVGLFDRRYKTIMDYEHYLRMGPKININFVPVVISCMRDGGQSQKDIKKSLRDIRNAQIETNTLSPFIAELNCIYLFSRYLLGKTIFGEIFRKMRNRQLSKFMRSKTEHHGFTRG